MWCLVIGYLGYSLPRFWEEARLMRIEMKRRNDLEAERQRREKESAGT